MAGHRDQIRQILRDIEDSGGETHHIKALLQHARAVPDLPADFHATLQRFARSLPTNTDAEDARYIARLRASLDSAARPPVPKPPAPKRPAPEPPVTLSPGALSHALHLIDQASRMALALTSLTPDQAQRLRTSLKTAETALRRNTPVAAAARVLAAEARWLADTPAVEAPFARRVIEIGQILDALAKRQAAGRRPA